MTIRDFLDRRDGRVRRRLALLAFLALPLAGACAHTAASAPETMRVATPTESAAATRIAAIAQPAPAPGEWTAYGRDPQGSRYSPLTAITRDNVAQLAVAWTYHTGENAPDVRAERPTHLEVTPIMVDGTLYIATPLGRVIALDPETGTERWKYDAKVPRDAHFGDFASRGVSTWLDAAAPAGVACRRRIVFATIDARLLSLDARDGAPCAGFGAGGIVDLRRGLHNAPEELTEYEVTSPPAVIGDLLVVGSAVADNGRTDAASGEVRAFDSRTGALRWTWHPVPRDSTDAAWTTWIGPRAHTTGAANAWSVIAADPARDLVFVPTGSASPDYYGGERLGDNRYANSVVALRASTGQVVWHFQAVHHDLWDFDVASPPALVDVMRDGRAVPAVLQATKSGQLFVLHRETGVPIFPVEERAVPSSRMPGEQASPTQPFNTVLPPLSPQRMTADDAWGPTLAAREACRAEIAGLRNDGPFTPPSFEGTLVLPSNIGGAHWGGVAFDPARQLAIVPVNRIAAMVQLIPLDRYDRAEARRESDRLGYEYTRMRGTPYVMRRRLLISPELVPCTPPPFGALVALDLRTGTKAWEVPLGTPRGMTGDVARTLGSPNLGGPIITAGGVLFIGATIDQILRAYDVETGRELWRAALPAGARATPMTYQVRPGGRQFVVVAAGGGEQFGEGDAIVAFALPGRE